MRCDGQGDASDAKDSKAEAGPYWSLMFEVSESTEKPVKQDEVSLAGGKWSDVVRECIIGALNTQMISKDDQIVSIYHRCCLLSCLRSPQGSNAAHHLKLACFSLPDACITVRRVLGMSND